MNYQISRSELALPIVGQGQNGTGQVFKVSRVFDSYGSTTWVKSPRGFISHFVYDVSTGAMIRRIEDVKTVGGTVNPLDVPDGWVTPPGGGLNLVTDYEIDRFGRVLKEFGPVHQVQLNGDTTTTAVRQVSFTVYNDAAREVRRATGYATGSPGSYVFKTVGSATISRTKVGDLGMIEETIESIRANNDIPLTATEDFSDQTKWRKWSFTESDQWGKAIQGRVYHLIPSSGFGSQGTNYEKVEYGYDAMNRLVRLKDETCTITRTVYDVRGLVRQTWVGTDDSGATDQNPGNGGAAGNNMVMVSENIYDDGESGGNGYLTEIIRKVDDDGTTNDRVEKRKYDYRGQLEEVKSNDGTREIAALYTYDNLGRVTEVLRYRGLFSDDHFLGKSVSHYDDDGRVYRTETFGADEETGALTEFPLVSNRWYDASGNVIKETGPNTQAAVKYVYDGIERNLARYVVLEGVHSGSGSGNYSSSGGGSGDFSFSSSSDSSGGPPGPGSSGSSDSSSGSSAGSGSGSGSSDSGSSGSSDSSGGGGSGSGSSGSSGGSSGSSWSGSSSDSSATVPVAPVCCCDEDTGNFTWTPPGTGQELCSDPTKCPPAVSPYPVRYATGELIYSVPDLDWKGFGFRWGQTRSYSNRLSGNGNGLNGYRWLSREMSYVALNQGPSGKLAAVVSGANSTLWAQPLASGFATMFGSKVQFIPRPSTKTFEVFEPDGSRKFYYDYSSDTSPNLRGKLRRIVNRYGNEMELDYHVDGRLLTAAWESGSRNGSFVYDYHSSGTGKTGRLWTITQVVDGVDLRRVVYDYYSTGDLMVAVVQDWNGSAWVEIRRMFHRYYGSGEANGFAHGLKIVIGPDGCRRMADDGITDPASQADSVLEPYSDYVFQYDSQRRVVLERVQGGSKTITYDYEEATPAPSYAETGKWATRTTETRPDGNLFVVYSNRGGKPILSILKKRVAGVLTGEKWYGYREYDTSYRTTLIATSAAVSSVSEPATLSAPLTVTLKDEEGLVETFEYVPETEAVAPGYLKSQSTQPGKAVAFSAMKVSHSYGAHGATGGVQGVFPRTSSKWFIGDGRETESKSSFAFFESSGTVGELPSGGGWMPAPNDISKDKVFLQETSQYDPAGNVILATRSERFHDTEGEGALKPPFGEATPKGRTTYTAFWPDGIGRTKVTADWGTNGGANYVRASDATAPVRGNPLVLVSTNLYGEDGDSSGSIDPMGIKTCWKSDAMGRRTELVENHQASGSGDDINRTTQFAYHSNSQLKTLTVKNGGTDQVTQWHYGVTVTGTNGGSYVCSNGLVREKSMPAGGTYSYRYNRQGQVIRYQDPNATVHEYDYDHFGRLTEDEASSLGTGIDDTIRRITQDYTDKGALSKVTSYLGTGSTVANQVEFKYTPWGQVGQDRQAHSGAAGSGTPSVTYGFRTNGSAHANDINPLWMITPSDHKTDYLYGTGDTDNHKLGRIESLKVQGESSDLVTYQYCGLDRFVKVGYVQPGVDLTYIIPGGDAGDPYGGWDRFGRTQEMPWAKGTTILERVLYGYNESSQRTWREAPVAPSDEDEAYQYDDLYQLIGRERGNLNVNRTAIGGVPVRKEEFDFDPIGNWQGYDVWQSGTKTLDQSRVHNTSNILTQIDGSSSLLAHDTAGNMTKSPPPEDGSWSHAQELKWDAWNRLIKVKVPGGATIAEYAYDGLARRTTKTVAGKVTHYYYNRQWRPVEEREGSSEEPSCIYDWGLRYRDDLVRRTKWTSQGSSGSESPPPASSGSGSSSGLVKLVNYALHDYYNVTAITDEYGEVVERYGYSGFGDVRFMTAAYADRMESAYEWDLLYKAQFRDLETGYYNYGFRYYVPLLGRWINRDPIGESGGLNLFAFVANNGVNGTDFLGLDPVEQALRLMIPKEIQDFFDNPPALPAPKTPQQKFDEWKAGQPPGKWWVKAKIPKCPCQLIRRCETFCYTVTPYRSTDSTELLYREVCWWEIPSTDKDPDSSPEKWESVSSPINGVVERFHPGASMEMRSKPVATGQTNQCTYDKNGKLITDGPGAGTADLGAPGGPPYTGPHWERDVFPVIWAAQADGAWVDNGGPGLLGRIDPSKAGVNLSEYLKFRPSYHQDCPKNP